jgi:hypothetical protein
MAMAAAAGSPNVDKHLGTRSSPLYPKEQHRITVTGAKKNPVFLSSDPNLSSAADRSISERGCRPI